MDRLTVLEAELDMVYSALFPLFPQGCYGFNEADVDTVADLNCMPTK